MRRSLTGLVSISFVGGLFGRAFEYLVYVTLAWSLGAGAVGAFSFGFVFLNLATMVAKLGLDKAARKYVPIHADDEARLTGILLVCLGSAFAVGCLTSVAIYLGSGVLSGLADESFGDATLLFLLGIPLMAVMTVGRAATTGFLTTKYSVYIKDVGQSGSAVVFVVVAGYVVGTVESVILAYVASLFVGSALAVVFLVRQGGFAGIRDPVFETRELLTYSIPLTLAAAAQYVISWTDVLMLGAFVDPDALGVYQVSYQTAVVLGFVMTAVSTIFPSVASDLYDSGQRDRLEEMYSALTKWVVYVAVFGYVFLAFYAEEILSIFGPAFVEGRLVLLLIGAVMTFSAVVGPAGMLLMMTDYERVEMVNTVFVSVLNVGLNYYLIQRHGVLGAAIATGLSLTILNSLRLLEVWHFLGMRPSVGRYWKGATGIGLAGSLMYAGTYLPLPAIPLVVLAGGLPFCVFVATLYVFGLDPEDRLLAESID